MTKIDFAVEKVSNRRLTFSTFSAKHETYDHTSFVVISAL